MVYFSHKFTCTLEKITLVLTEVYLRHMMDICAQGTKAKQNFF